MNRPPRSAEPGPGSDPEAAWLEVNRAQSLLRRAAVVLDRVATEEEAGWPVPFSPVRYLVLAHARRRPRFGIRPRRLARILELGVSSLAHHLDVLEQAELITRAPLEVYDGRNVAVRLTERGLYAFWRMESALRRDLDREP